MLGDFAQIRSRFESNPPTCRILVRMMWVGEEVKVDDDGDGRLALADVAFAAVVASDGDT